MRSLRLLFLLTLLTGANFANAQHFQWAATASYIDLRYGFACTDMNNNLVVAGEISQWDMYRGNPSLFDARGDSIDLSYTSNNTIVVCYGPDGKILWHQLLGREKTLAGMCPGTTGGVVLLLTKNERYDNEEDEEDENESTSSLHGTRYYLVQMTANDSKELGHFDLDKQEKLDVNAFIAAPDGGFLLSGFAHPGTLVKGLNTKAGPAGGDFILSLSSKGTPRWADVISYDKKTCCSYFSNMCKVAVAPDGTAYLAGTFYHGAIFGNGKKITSSQGTPKNQYDEPYESYVACYSPKGTLNWVKSSGEKSLNTGLVADASGVYISCNAMGSDKYFNSSVDTSKECTRILAGFDIKGKLKFIRSDRYKQSEWLALDEAHHLYMLGTTDYFPRYAPKFGTDTMLPSHKIFIARFDSDGKFEWVKQANVPVETQNEKLFLLRDRCNNLYIAGTMWFGLPAKMYWWDHAFLHGDGYGPAPLVAKFANTLPPKAVLSSNAKPAATPVVLTADSSTANTNMAETPKDSSSHENACRISPGPWTLIAAPNPFSEHCTLMMGLSYGDAATLEIRDVHGRLIRTLFAQKQLAAGKYEMEFTSNMAPGNYIATLSGTETMVTCRLVIR